MGGLWTAAHPPLLIWQMAGLTALFGPSEWALRAPVALAGIGCVLTLYLFVRRLAANPVLARIAAAVLLLTPYFTQYARRAQLDVPVLFWILVCLYAGWRGLSGPLRWFALSGIALGLGLMTKILVAFLAPITLGVFLLSEAAFGSRGRAARGFLGVALMVTIGVAIAAPWHLYMTAKPGASYWTQALGYHVLSRTMTPLEGHSSSLGVLYWPHQILIRLGPFFPFLLLGLSGYAARDVLVDGARRFLLCWLLVPLLAFTVVATKFHPYVLLFLLPLVVFAALGIHATLRWARHAWLPKAAVALALVSALVLTILPLARGHGSWRELRSELRRISPDRVLLICEDPTVGRYQMRAAGLPLWSVVPRDSAAIELSYPCVVVETSRKEAALHPLGFKERWRNRRFVLFVASPRVPTG